MAMIRLPKDFREFLELLNDHGVEYLIVGAYAVNFHGYVRSTGDLDVWVGVSRENAAKMAKVMRAFGFSEHNARVEPFLDEKKILQMGIPPSRIDILMSVSGLDFAACYSQRIEGIIDGVAVGLLNLPDLRTNKQASGRPKDLSDLENLPE